MDRATLKAAAKGQIKGNIGILFVISLLNGLIVGALGAIPLVGTIAGMLLGAAFTLAVINIYLDLGYGRKPEIADLFSRVRDVLPAFCTQFLVGLFTFLWSLLFIVPGIIKSYAYSMAFYIKHDHPEYDWKQCMDESQRYMKGYKWQLFCLDFSFIGWILLGFLCCGIGTLWVVPYQNAARANFYENLKAIYDPEVVVEEPVAEAAAGTETI